MKKIEFLVDFHTDENVTLQLKYKFTTNSGESNKSCLQLDEISRDVWGGCLTFEDNIIELSYGYELACNGETIRTEWSGKPHSINLTIGSSLWRVHDKWLDSPFCNYLQSGLFNKFYQSKRDTKGYEEIEVSDEYRDSLIFDVPACGLSENETLALVGDDDHLGAWAPQRAIRMKYTAPNRWQCIVNTSSLQGKILSYKFIALNNKTGEARWEEGGNRTLYITIEPPTVRRITFEGIDFGAPKLRVAGTVMPLFSLRSESSWGIGDFGDLKRFAEWLAATGQRVLQLLPVNDTTIYGGAGDSYPYNCVSVFALHPQYIDISALPQLKDGRVRAGFTRRAKRLNEGNSFDYTAVNELKENYLRKLFEESSETLLANESYKSFAKEQQEWLTPYCAYRFLSKKICAGPGNWGDYASYDESTTKRLTEQYPDAEREMQYHSYVQFALYSQLKEAHEYALSLGVALKGDIPIGVAPDGVDVWCNRELFNCNGSAGAPPDAFSADGQNWGFPTYNWEVMARDDYSWWRRRLKYMAKFFDSYRIDHILGFFRIWEIPSYVSSGLSGHFRPSIPLSIEEIEKAGFHFDVKHHSCASLAELPTDRPADLLFIPDETREGYYHPRIMASDTKRYRALDERSKHAFDRIYEDFFYHRHTDFWFGEAMKKLSSLLSATSMTACGEDLGMIPQCVPWAMKNLQVLSLEIQRMPKEYGVRFADTASYPYLSVATPSTHDMSTLREWWTESAEETQHFYNHTLHREGKAPSDMSGDIAKQILKQHLESPSMLAMIAWQDWMAMDECLRFLNPYEERINIPANRGHVWNYRMHMTIEQLQQEKTFNKTLLQMLSDSSRILSAK
jgi:4-alpha-glucanotransferase